MRASSVCKNRAIRINERDGIRAAPQGRVVEHRTFELNRNLASLLTQYVVANVPAVKGLEFGRREKFLSPSVPYFLAVNENELDNRRG